VNAGDSNPYPVGQNGAAEKLQDAVAAPRWLVEDRSSPEEIAIMRAMSGQKRLKVAEQMFWMAREIKAAGVRHQHPNWSEAEVTAEVNRIFLHGAE
jgi:hypothetical protein